MFETIEPGVHIVKTPAQQPLDRGSGLKKLREGGLHEHALADAWPLRCAVKPTTDALAQPNRHLAPRGLFALANGSKVNAVGLRIQFCELLHLTFPNAPRSRSRRRDAIDEANLMGTTEETGPAPAQQGRTADHALA
jgi:hypothetical protein